MGKSTHFLGQPLYGQVIKLLDKAEILEISKDIEVVISEEKIAVNKIGMSVDKVIDAAKTITTIKVRLPENGSFFTKTLFLTEKHLAIKPLFDLSNSES